MVCRRVSLILAMLLWFPGLIAPLRADDPTAEQLQFFETKIRPVLVNHCYSCHSEQAIADNKLRGELKVDSRAALLAGGESGPAVEPGNPDAGTLLSALKHESFEMPPSGKLSDEIIADFEAWIEMGAPDPRAGEAPTTRPQIDIAAGKQHWAFRPLSLASPPDREPILGLPESWPVNSVDRWISAAQVQRNIQPAPLAPPQVLVRRLYFDLIGLPPSPEEMQHWSAQLTSEQDPNSVSFEGYVQLIDHLLDHPGYGERWARHWMDVARFAESHGYEQDYDRPTAYHYRDFLIRALNQDLPYDTFVKWQLAGDEYQTDDPLAMMATGFLGGGAFPTQLTEAEFESARYDELDDMIGTTGVAFLGLSIGCARCHDHKYDPIPVSDYYQLAAVFRTAIRSEVELDLDPQESAARRQLFEARERELQGQLAQTQQDGLPLFREWLKANDSQPIADTPWLMLSGTLASSAGTVYELQSDGSLLATSEAPAKEVLTYRASLPGNLSIASLRLETFADPSLPNGGPGRANNGNFALGDLRVVIQRGEEMIPVSLHNPRATHQQNESSLSIAASLDDDPVSGWAVDGQIGRSQAAVFESREALQTKSDDQLVITMRFEHPNARHVAGRMRWSISARNDAPLEVGVEETSILIVDAIEKCRATDCNDAAALEIALPWFAARLPAWQETQQQLAALRAEGTGAQLTKVLVTSEGLAHLPHHADGRGFPHFYPDVYQLRRGDVTQKLGVVTEGYLQVLMVDGCDLTTWQQAGPESSRTSYRRKAFAEWLMDVERGAGHLAARVMVNRLWQHHFGRGIVATPNDFGLVGAPPSHPELLDSLAAEFIDSGWSLKAIHRRILTSAAYARSSQPPTQETLAATIDPENQTWWRREPRRLEAEAIRDSLLVVSNSLDSRMHGPGTLDANMKRRSIYFFIKRSQLIPMMMLFDWPEHLVSIGQRSATTVAPQALMFMNSPQGRSYATEFAKRLIELDDSAAIDRAYWIAFGRAPGSQEQMLGEEFLRRQAQRHVEAGHGNPGLLARIDYCQTLMSLNEFVYID